MFHTIDCSQINLDETTFLMSYPLESRAVMASVGTIGVLQPVIVSGCPCEGGYQLIAGFRRAYACRKLGVNRVNARIHQVNSDFPLGAFLLALHENASHRTFNHVEKALILSKLAAQFQCGRDEIIQHYLPLLGLAPVGKVLQLYLKIAGFEDELKPYLAAHDLPMTVLELLADLAPADRMAVFALVTHVKLGVNKLKEVLTYLDEIALRDGRPIHQVLAAPQIRAVLEHDQMPGPQKTDRLRQMLREMRYPQLTTLEHTYHEQLNRLELPHAVRLKADPSFERNDLTVAFRFETPEQLHDYADALLRLAQQPALRRVLQIVQGATETPSLTT